MSVPMDVFDRVAEGLIVAERIGSPASSPSAFAFRGGIPPATGEGSILWGEVNGAAGAHEVPLRDLLRARNALHRRSSSAC